MMPFDAAAETRRFNEALEACVARLEADKSLLAAVQVGSLTEDVIWKREVIWLWIIEADGVTRRRLSDGEEPRVFRTLVEHDINIHAELIPRDRFKRMVEGNARTAFSHNHFARRRLLYSHDASIARWFDDANRLATLDQQKELLISTTYAIHGLRYARWRLERTGDVEIAAQQQLGVAHGIAAIEIVRAGEICETTVIHRGRELAPELFGDLYDALVAAPADRDVLERSLAAADSYLDAHGEDDMRPLLELFAKHRRVLPLSEINDFFAHSQLYPWHLESACEWLAERGRLEKVSTPLSLTKRSRDSVEEPAYELVERT